MKSRLWQYFKCHQCGKCCTEIGLPYDHLAIFKMADLLKIDIKEVINTYYGQVDPDGLNWVSEDAKRTPCPFLTKSHDTHFCKIYEVRPEGCRLYPIDTTGGRQDVACPAWEIAFKNLKKIQEEESL